MLIRGLTLCLLAVCMICNSCDAKGAVTTKSELNIARKEQVEKFEKNGIRTVIRDYADTVVLIYSVSNEADDDNLVYNAAARSRLKKHHYKVGVTSGFLVSPNVVCTTYSGIMNGDSFVVSVNSEFRPQVTDSGISLGENDYKAELIKAIPNLDLAFLRITPKKGKSLHYVKLGNDAALINGKDRILLNNCVVIGKAKGENFTNAIKPANSKNNFSMFATGIEKLSYHREKGKPILIIENPATNPAIIPETDGGAILDMDGKLIGLAKFSCDSFANVTQSAIPVSVIKKGLSIAVPSILRVANDKPIGIEVADAKDFKISKILRHTLKISDKLEKFAVAVKSVSLKSIADDAGIQAGDVILKFNSDTVTDAETFANLEKASIGDQTVTLKVLRKNNLLDIEIYR